jgi:hypothetical protein
VQGANDPRVKKAESDQIVVALRERNFPVEYIVAPDEGHGFARPVNNMAMYAAAEKFLTKHIQGVRHQPEMPAEVATRLKEITVDPKTVEKPKAMIASLAAPTPAFELAPGVYRYKAVLDRGGQKTEMTTGTVIADNAGAWKVVDSMQTPAGEATDSGVYAKRSLLLTERALTQGPVSIKYAVANNKATGQMSMGSQARPIDADLGGATYGDGPGAGFVFGALPLADGYTTTVRNFNVQSQQVQNAELRVTGTETITVPAGTFDCFKVEVSLASGGKNTLWIAKSPRKMVKATQTGPQLGGATVTSELQP